MSKAEPVHFARGPWRGIARCGGCPLCTNNGFMAMTAALIGHCHARYAVETVTQAASTHIKTPLCGSFVLTQQPDGMFTVRAADGAEFIQDFLLIFAAGTGVACKTRTFENHTTANAFRFDLLPGQV